MTPLEQARQVRTAPHPATQLDAAVGRRAMALFAHLLPVLLAGHALFDHGFAYLGVPGTPAYITEMVLALGLVAAMGTAHPFQVAFERSRVPMALLVALLVWGGWRVLVQWPTYGLMTLRDFALFYYMLFALVTAAVVAAVPGWRERLTRNFRRFIPWLLAWSPVPIVVAVANRDVGPLVPGAQVPFLAHRLGDLEVILATAVVFVWLVPGVATRRQRACYTVIGLLLLAAAGTQARGGLVGSALVLLIAVAVAGRRRRGVSAVAAALIVLFILLVAISPQVKSNRRTLSLFQLEQNVKTIAGGQGGGDLNGTVKWRSDLWKLVLSRTRQEGKGLLGWGFGPNLGTEFAFGGVPGELPLRSPHNSHLDIVARTGPIGAALWVALWVAWFAALLRRRWHCRRHGDVTGAGVIEVLMLAALAMLINAYFDPALEAAPAAVWLWVVFGLGLTAPWGLESPSEGRAVPHSVSTWRATVPSWRTGEV